MKKWIVMVLTAAMLICLTACAPTKQVTVDTENLLPVDAAAEAEIRQAIRRPVGATSLDGVKRRTRSGMGRCQGGFCSPAVVRILSEELGIPMEQVTKSGGDSYLLTGSVADALKEEWK